MDVPSHLLESQPIIASDDQLRRAQKMAAELYALESEKIKLEERQREISERMMELQHKEIPDFFGSIHTDRIGLPDHGVDIVVGPYYKANIAVDWEEAKRVEAFKALETSDGTGLIRVTVSVGFAKDEWEQAMALRELIRTQWSGANSHSIMMEMAVPWNSLTAWVRERHQNGETLVNQDGEPLPWETIGATIGQIAKVKKRK